MVNLIFIDVIPLIVIVDVITFWSDLPQPPIITLLEKCESFFTDEGKFFKIICSRVTANLFARRRAEIHRDLPLVFVNRKLDHLIGETLTTKLMMRLG